jgi:hypothetical protein
MRIAIGLLLLASTAHAGNNELTLGSNNRALKTSSANAVTDDSLIGGSLTYGRDLGLAIFPRLELWAQATFAWGSAEGMMFQTLSTELDTLGLMLGARARYQLHRRLDATARLDIGSTRAALAIRDSAGHTASDQGWGAITTTALGLDCYAYRGERFALAVRFELGLTATSSIPLTATPESNGEGTLQLEMTAASLGDLNLSGPAFAAAIAGQF